MRFYGVEFLVVGVWVEGVERSVTFSFFFEFEVGGVEVVLRRIEEVG